MVTFKKIQRQNLIQIYTKTHQIAPLKKLLGGGACPQTPLAKRHALHPARWCIFLLNITPPPCLNMDLRHCIQVWFSN